MKKHISNNKNTYFLLCLATLFIVGIAANKIMSTYKIPYSLTIITPAHEKITSALSPFGKGFDRDLVEEFKKFIIDNNFAKYQPSIKWRTAENAKQALKLVSAGQADIAVGFAYGLNNDSTNQKIQPNYNDYEFGPHIYQTENIEATLPNTDKANTLQTELHNDVAIQKILSSFNASPTPTVLDLNSWHIWKPFVKDFSTNSKQYTAEIELSATYNWVWNKNNKKLVYALQSFWGHLLQPKNQTLKHLQTRYYSYFPNKVDKHELSMLYNIIKNKLPRYTKAINSAASKSNIDPLLFVAVIMQESRFEEDMVSYTGVQGIMQLTKRTANFLKVDRMNPVQAISGGARYLNMIWENLEDKNLSEWDRWFFTLAAFNQGPTRINGAIKLSQKLGGTGKTWLELKEVLPLLSQKKYASMIGQNTGRGGEAVRFVERVRWYYHILQGVVALGLPEAQNLTPLLAAPTS